MERNNQRIVIALILIVAGLIMILDNFQIIPWEIRHRVLTWQSIIIVIGLFQLSKGHFRGGVILLVVGSILWINQYGPYGWSELWPVLLIAVGVSMFLKGRGHKNIHNTGDTTNYIDDLAIFGGSNKIISDKSFRGGKITSVFGGIDLDLRDAELENGKATVDTFTIFGAFKTIVPDDWKVNSNITCVFGGFNDKRVNKPVTESKNELTITGVVIFGGGDLLN